MGSGLQRQVIVDPTEDTRVGSATIQRGIGDVDT